MVGPDCGDSEGRLDDDEVLWRRVKDHPDHIWKDHQNDCWRPNPDPPSNATQFDKEESRRAMSCFWERHLTGRHLLGASSVTDPSRNYTLVFEMRVGDINSPDCEAEHDPDGGEPIGCAHSSIVMQGTPNSSTRKQIRRSVARRMVHFYGTVLTAPPPQP
jgi:hypothetical protein